MNGSAVNSSDGACYSFSHVRGHKPLFWKRVLGSPLSSGYDYVWLFDADVRPALFPLQTMLVAMARTQSQISQPQIAPLSSSATARSSDWSEFRWHEPELSCMVRRNASVEVMTPIFTRRAWELVHTHLLGQVADAALAASAWELDTIWCPLVQHYMPDKPACTCLLYTSPSPRDRTRSRMPSSA